MHSLGCRRIQPWACHLFAVCVDRYTAWARTIPIGDRRPLPLQSVMPTDRAEKDCIYSRGGCRRGGGEAELPWIGLGLASRFKLQSDSYSHTHAQDYISKRGGCMGALALIAHPPRSAPVLIKYAHALTEHHCDMFMQVAAALGPVVTQRGCCSSFSARSTRGALSTTNPQSEYGHA